jgi:hypothetical protein
MIKRVSLLGAAVIIAVLLLLLVNREASARWYRWDDRLIEVRRTCRDGIHFAFGMDIEGFPLILRGLLEPSGTELFRLEDVYLPEQPIPYDDINYYDIFIVPWEDGNRQLEPGDQVTVQEVGPYDPWYPASFGVTVADCRLFPDVATSAINYQGILSFEGETSDGLFDFRFTLWDAGENGDLVAGPTDYLGTAVSEGHFNVQLDFGTSVFSGRDRWLETEVRPAGSTAAFTTLTPRQQILAVPYASSVAAGAVISDAMLAPVLTLHNVAGDGLHITDAFNGLIIDSARNSGIEVRSSGGTGISASTTYTWGVGVTASGGYYGVVGASTSSRGIGVSGRASGPDGVGVSGSASGPDGVGIRGSGQVGVSGSGTPGVRGSSYYGNAVRGESTQDHAIEGLSVDGYGLRGYSENSFGVAGYSPDEVGVYGVSDTGWAGVFYSTQGNGVWVTAAAGGAGLLVSGGSKNAVVPTDQGDRLLYTEESTEVWFTDYGFGTLTDGAAFIPIDPIFRQTVNLDEPFHVFVQAYGDAELYVTNRTADGFEVHLGEGDPNVEFSYRLVARRRGFEGDRLEPAPQMDQSSAAALEARQTPERQVAPEDGR